MRNQAELCHIDQVSQWLRRPIENEAAKQAKGIKESLREGTQSKNSNYDYLMSLFDQYDSTKPDNLNMIQNHQKENKEKINTYIDKIS